MTYCEQSTTIFSMTYWWLTFILYYFGHEGCDLFLAVCITQTIFYYRNP